MCTQEAMASRALAALLTVAAFVGFVSVPRALATDPTQLQDFCVADNNNQGGKYLTINCGCVIFASPCLHSRTYYIYSRRRMQA